MKPTRMVALILFSAAGLLAVAELFAHYRLGLGTPPLYVADTLTEYRLKPNQRLYRFDNLIEVNAYSMRSGPLPPSGPVAGRRVLVFGDSVVWGGAVLDQSLIATELLRQSGVAEVGNVAAPSWGPGNWLGWARRFGFLNASDVVLVISSHDAADNPNLTPFTGDPNHPLKPPVSALSESVERYLLPRLGIRMRVPSAPDPVGAPSGEPTSPADPRVQRGLSDLRNFLKLARASGARVMAVQFADRQEATSGTFQPGNHWIAQTFKQEGVPSVQAGPIFRGCGSIASLYTDDIHPYTAAGQACVAKAIQQVLRSAPSG
jgi:hypothetical protein